MHLLLFFILFNFFAYAPHAFSGLAENERFYDALLACRPLSLSCLTERNLVREIGPLTYQFPGQGATSSEIRTGKIIASALGLPVVLCPNLLGMEGVPLFDAIIFNYEGTPIANASLKERRSSSFNGDNFQKEKQILREARQSLRNYDQINFPVWLTRPVSKPKALQVLHHLFGIGEEMGRRDAWSVMTLTDLDNPRYIDIGMSDEMAGMFLRLRENAGGLGKPLAYLNLDALHSRTFWPNDFQSYIFIHRDLFVQVDPSGFTEKSLSRSRFCSQAL